MPPILAERKVVGSVEIEEVAPPIPPVPPVPYIPLSFLEEHNLISKYLRKEGKKYKCPSVTKIAEVTKIDEETVRLHRDIMEIDECVTTVNKEAGDVICDIDSMSRLITNLRKLRT